MKLLHLQPVSTIFVAISAAAKPVNHPVDGHVHSLRGKEYAPDAPFIGPLSAPHEATRQLSHEPLSSLGDPSDDHRVLGIDTDADSKRFEKPPTRALQQKQGKMADLANELGMSLDVAKLIDDLNPDIYYDVDVIGDVYMYPDGYKVNYGEERIPYPNKNVNVKFHVTGQVVVRGMPEGSVMEVHSDQHVTVIETGSESTLKVHSNDNVEVLRTGRGSTVNVYANGEFEVLTYKDYAYRGFIPVTTTVDQYVTVTNVGGSRLEFGVSSIPKSTALTVKSGKGLWKKMKNIFTKAEGSGKMIKKIKIQKYQENIFKNLK